MASKTLSKNITNEIIIKPFRRNGTNITSYILDGTTKDMKNLEKNSMCFWNDRHNAWIIGKKKYYTQLSHIVRILDEYGYNCAIISNFKENEETEVKENEVSSPSFYQQLSAIQKSTFHWISLKMPSLNVIFSHDSDDILDYPSFTHNGQKVVMGNVLLKKCKGVGSSLVKIRKNVLNLMLDKKWWLIYGECQSGKTSTIQGACLAHMQINECSVIVVLRDSIEDSKQLEKRSLELKDEFIKHQKEQGFNSYMNVVCADSNKQIPKLKQALSGEKPSLIICLGNKSQLFRIKNVLDNIQEPRYVVAIDEADHVAYGKDSAQFRYILSDSILNNAGRVYAITATSFDMIFTEDRIKNSSIIRIKPKSGIYKGINNFVKIDLSEKIHPLVTNKNHFESDPNLLSVMREMGDNDCNHHQRKYSTRSKQPVICLFKNATQRNYQMRFLKEISTHPSLKMWCGIVFNGDGITIYHPNIMSHMVIKGKKGKTIDDFPNVLRFSDASIGDALQYFEIITKNTTIKISHIAIISDRMADRSISFVSNNYNVNKQRGWRCSHMYYVPSKNATIPMLLQAVGRLCGNFDDDISGILYAPKEVCENIIKGYYIQKEMLQRVDESILDESIKKCMKEMGFRKEKIPSRKLGTQENAKITNVVMVGNDEGYKLDFYTKKLGEIEKLKYENIDIQQEDLEEIKEETQEVQEKSYISLLVEKITKYVKSNIGKENTFKTANEWLQITGLCGFKNKTVLHHKMMTYLVSKNILERNGNKLRLLL